jgi:hypothetical protein
MKEALRTIEVERMDVQNTEEVEKERTHPQGNRGGLQRMNFFGGKRGLVWGMSHNRKYQELC